MVRNDSTYGKEKRDGKIIVNVPSDDEIFVLAYGKFGDSQKTIDISNEYDNIDKTALGCAISILGGYRFVLTKSQADGVRLAYRKFNKILDELS